MRGSKENRDCDCRAIVSFLMLIHIATCLSDASFCLATRQLTISYPPVHLQRPPHFFMVSFARITPHRAHELLLYCSWLLTTVLEPIRRRGLDAYVDLEQAAVQPGALGEFVGHFLRGARDVQISAGSEFRTRRAAGGHVDFGDLLAFGRHAQHLAGAVNGDPQVSLGIEGVAVGHAVLTLLHVIEDALVGDGGRVGVVVEGEDVLGGRVGVVHGLVVIGPAHAVGDVHALEDTMQRQIRVQPEEGTWIARARVSSSSLLAPPWAWLRLALTDLQPPVT